MLNLSQPRRGHRLIVIVRATFQIEGPEKTKILEFPPLNG
jgi:hypothetical protein